MSNTSTSEGGGVTGVWADSKFNDEKRKEKFLQLMGAKKRKTTNPSDPSYSSFSLQSTTASASSSSSSSSSATDDAYDPLRPTVSFI